MNTTYKRGFTLIELLVVIAIIGLLASIVLASLNTARQKGRDAKRVADIKQLQLALELYYDANSAYPVSITSANLVTPGYISVIPTDPSTSQNYFYTPYSSTSGTASTCVSYHLGASLEQANNAALSSDANISAPPSGYQICSGGPSADFSGANTAKCTSLSTDIGVACYDVKP